MEGLVMEEAYRRVDNVNKGLPLHVSNGLQNHGIQNSSTLYSSLPLQVPESMHLSCTRKHVQRFDL